MIRNKRIVIAGGSGFLGVSLANHLTQRGANVTLLSRSKCAVNGPWESQTWDARTVSEWAGALEESDAIVNFTGRTVDCIKTPDHCDEILRSRVESTLALGRAIAELNNPPPVWVQMSTAHIYGDPPKLVCREDSPFGYGLAPDVAKAWEQAFAESKLEQQRGVLLRTSFVVGRDVGAGGGALASLRRITRWGLGGTIGNGTQGMSWIHETDMNQIVVRAISGEMEGPYIVSSPSPVSQREFMQHLRKAIGVPFGLPAPEWLVRLGAHYVLRTDPELALFGRYVMPQRLLDEGFEFKFPTLPEALANLV